MNRFILMVGLPGSGKSTYAHFRVGGGPGVIVSTDNYFMKNGQYVFEPAKLELFHLKTFKQVAKYFCDDVPLVILDNTNLRPEHRLEYIKLAVACGYDVEAETMPMGLTGDEADLATLAARNKHGVPLESIKRMLSGYMPVTARELCGIAH